MRMLLRYRPQVHAVWLRPAGACGGSPFVQPARVKVRGRLGRRGCRHLGHLFLLRLLLLLGRRLLALCCGCGTEVGTEQRCCQRPLAPRAPPQAQLWPKTRRAREQSRTLWHLGRQRGSGPSARGGGGGSRLQGRGVALLAPLRSPRERGQRTARVARESFVCVHVAGPAGANSLFRIRRGLALVHRDAWHPCRPRLVPVGPAARGWCGIFTPRPSARRGVASGAFRRGPQR